jgi:hypothetical protein
MAVPKFQKTLQTSSTVEDPHHMAVQCHTIGAHAVPPCQLPTQLFNELVEKPSLLMYSNGKMQSLPDSKKPSQSYVEGWESLSCPSCASGKQCCLGIESWSAHLVLGCEKVLNMQVPNLRCKTHLNREPFSVLKIWNQVVQARERQAAFFNPDIVVLNDNLIMTGEAYRYGIKAYNSWRCF